MNYKKINILIIIFLASLSSTLIFWNVLDLTSLIDPLADDRVSNLQKYFEKYQAVSLNDFLIQSSSLAEYYKSKLDIGYDLLTFTSKFLGLDFNQFLFLCVFTTFVAYIMIFINLTSCSYKVIYLILIILAFFWMRFTLGAALRQGLAITFLFYFLFGSKRYMYIKALIIISLASLIHFSAIIFIPYLIFEKIFINRLKLLFVIFSFVIILYVFNYNFFISDIIFYFANLLEFDLRALKAYKVTNIPVVISIPHPTTGFSINKLLATIIPIFFFFISLYYFNDNYINKIQKRMGLFYIYPSLIGMALSQFSYYDRILLYSWTFSPLLLTFFCFKTYPLLKLNIKKAIKQVN